MKRNESEFLSILFANLAKTKARYAVMRNYESLPLSTEGSDLDLLIDHDNRNDVINAVYMSIRQANGQILGTSRAFSFQKVFAIGRTSAPKPAWWGLRIDINIGLHFRGQNLLAASDEWPIVQHRGIPVLEDGFASVLGCLKEILNNGRLPRRYLQSARTTALDGWQPIKKLLAPMGPDALRRFQHMLTEPESAIGISQQCKRFRHDVLKYARLRSPVKSTICELSNAFSKIRRYWRPSGTIIAVMGVDGSGKSTVIKSILPALNAATHNSVVVRHLRPTFLPPLANLKSKPTDLDAPNLDPHGSTPSGVIGSLIRLVYITSDYILGYWVWTRPLISKQPAVVIFDRYAYDLAIDPRRFRIGLSGRVGHWFASIVPKPDLVFCLYGDPALISKRKGELSEDETRRQVDALRSFAEAIPNAICISTEATIDECRDKVLNALISFLKHR